MDIIPILFISICAFGAIVLLCVIFYRMKKISGESKEITTRLEFWLSERSEQGQYASERQKEDTDETFTKRILLPLGEQVGHWFSEKVPYHKQSTVRKLLIKAGFRDKKSLQFFYAVKIFLGIAISAIGLFLLSIFGKNIQAGFALALTGGAVGFILPNILLDKFVTKRQVSIDRILPDALDLLVICTEAGMGIDQSLLRVAANLGSQGKDLSDEIILTNREMNLGQDRSVCWNNLGERSKSEELKNLARVITQSEKVGASIGGVLRNQSDFLRVKRKQKAEETAAQMTIKMMLPMAFFIFPCVMVVSIGPPILKLMTSLKGGLL